MRVATRFLLLAVAVALIACIYAPTASVASEAVQYRDCESCVANGWGWSFNKNECGAFLNTNCDPDLAEEEDEEDEDEEDEVESNNGQAAQSNEPFRIPDPAPLPSEPLGWANTEQTTQLWQLVNGGDIQSLRNWLYREPGVVHLRAEDGRGPLFWAYEYQRFDMVDLLLERGADPDAMDVNNQKPEDLLPEGARRSRDEL